MYKLNKKKGGTILQNDIYTPEEAFNKFLDKSNIEYLNSGGSGIILKAQFIGDISETPYYTFDSINISSPVTEIVIKIVLLNELILPDKSNLKNFNWSFNGSTLLQDNYNGFINEINTQCDVVLKTVGYLEPISPTIVYSDILTNNSDIQTFINILYNKSRNDENIKKLIKDLLVILNRQYFYKDEKMSKSKIGFIVMELVTPNFNSMRNMFLRTYKKIKNDSNVKKLAMSFSGMTIDKIYENSNFKELNNRVYELSTLYNFELYKNMARWLLIELACKCGITQADFHFGNFLIDPIYKGYFEDKLINEPIDVYFSLSPININVEGKSPNKRFFTPIKEDNIILKKSNSNLSVLPINNSSDSFESIDLLDDDDIDVNMLDPKYRQKGGKQYINEGKVILVDYGLSNKIPNQYIVTFKMWYNFLYNNIDSVTTEKMKKIINEILVIIHSINRNDGANLVNFGTWYSWIYGGYFNGGPEDKDELLSGKLIDDSDIEMMRSIIKSRKIAIKNLEERFKSFKFAPFTLPLSEEEINKRIYRGFEKTGGNIQNRYNNEVDDIVNKSFETIGYGLLSRDYLIKKINKERMEGENKQFKIFENSLNQTPISIKTGGKKKKRKTRNKSKKHNKKTRKNNRK